MVVTDHSAQVSSIERGQPDGAHVAARELVILLALIVDVQEGNQHDEHEADTPLADGVQEQCRGGGEGELADDHERGEADVVRDLGSTLPFPLKMDHAGKARRW